MIVPEEESLESQVKMELLVCRRLALQNHCSQMPVSIGGAVEIAHYLNNHPSLRVPEEVIYRSHLENRCKPAAHHTLCQHRPLP